MITGFNTDVVHAGVTYHVQTEDKGTETPLILSLVYVGGAILASKRTSYKDLLDSGYDTDELTERLQRQHKLICAAIKAGRIDDLKKMGEGGAQAPAAKSRAPKAPAAKAPAARAPRPETPKQETPPAPPAPVRDGERVAPAAVSTPPVERAERSPAPAPAVQPQTVIVESKLELTTLEDPEFFRPVQPPPPPPEVAPAPPPPPAPAVVPEAATTPAPEVAKTFYIRLLDDEGDFRAGELVTIRVHVGRGPYGSVAVRNAEVTIKVLGTTFRPLIVSTETDDEGVAVVRALLPRFTSGRAAILIRARSEGYEAEMRRIIKQA